MHDEFTAYFSLRINGYVIYVYYTYRN